MTLYFEKCLLINKRAGKGYAQMELLKCKERFTKPEMEALQFDRSKKALSLVKIDLPTVTDRDDVIVKVTYAGVCGTDIHILGGSFPCRERPFIPGHEFCGVVTLTGSGVRNVVTGDRVVVDPNRGCDMCTNCNNGKYHLCPTGSINNAIGIFSDGGWAQYCKVPAQQVHRIPDSMTFQQAVLCEPLSCVCHGWGRVAPLPIGSSVLVTGAGIIGNLWVCVLHHSGHRNVTVVEPVQERRNLVQDLNTGYTCLSPGEIQALKEASPQWGVDVCVDCSGNERAIQQGLSMLLPGGKLCIFGVAAPTTTISISPFEIFKKELTILGVLVNPFSFQKALHLIEAMGSRYLDYEKLRIKVYSLEQHQQAFEDLKTGIVAKAIFKLSSV